MRRQILAWYTRERRDFPWRRTHDPYAVLVSEVMLQQTQAARVVDRFERFMRRFPTANALAAAPPADVIAEWSGLGYNRRAVMLQRAAAHVSRNGWPRKPSALQQLPGVGSYTARAVASLAFGRAVGVVDTNVRRWLVRRLAIEDRPTALQQAADLLAAAGQAGAVADEAGDAADEVAAWTHASMEFGAAVCRARIPRCEACPIRDGCPSFGSTRPVPSVRRPPFRGSRRARRGALLRALAAADGYRLSLEAARGVDSMATLADLVATLEADGLVHRRGDELRLGAAPPPTGAAVSTGKSDGIGSAGGPLITIGA